MTRIIVLICLCLISFSAFNKEDKIPRKIERSIPLLARHLTKGKISQKDKAHAIYTWITHNVAFNYEALQSSNYLIGVSPSKVLKQKKAVSDGFCELMKAMLDVVGIESEVVDGYVHDVAWEPGDIVFEDSHTWMAMKLDGEWTLADPTWDAGYIGRKPYDRKYHPKRYLIPLKFYKKEAKRQRVEEKRAKTEEERLEKFEDKPKYKDEIGFVAEPTEEFFAIHVDSFLVNHLPVNPIWQLRNDYISVEDFSKPFDSLMLRLGEDGGNSIDYLAGIAAYLEQDFFHHFIENGEEGFKYNHYNPGVKAKNYYNFMQLIHQRQVQKYTRGSIYEIEESKHPALKAVNDTIIKYTKLYKTFERNVYKNRKAFDKDKYNTTRNRDKMMSKYVRKVASENEKLIQYIKSNNEKIKKNLERLEETEERILAKFPLAAVFAKKEKDLDSSHIYAWRDSMQVVLDSLGTIRDFQKKRHQKTSFISLINDIRYVDYLLDVNGNAILFKTYSNNEFISEVDSLILYHAEHAVDLYKDSLRAELIQRNVMDMVKKGSTYIRLSRTAFMELKNNHQINETLPYETYMQSKYLEIVRLAKIINENGAHFNKQVGPIIKQEETIKTIERKMEDQAELKEEKNEYILEQEEKAHERNTKLIEKMQEDTKVWKEKYRPQKK